MKHQSLCAQEVLNPGRAQGPILKLTEALSFWGGFNPQNGCIIDKNHPQVNKSISGKILAIPGSRGSAGTPGGVAEALRRQVGPAGIVLLQSDVNITIGAQVADYLYGTKTPVIRINNEDFLMMESGLRATINNAEIVMETD